LIAVEQETRPGMVVTRPGRVPIKSWAVDVDAGAMRQAERLSNLPFVQRHIALMPDAHQGYAMPIGGVMFADRVLVPYAVGNDIGCGMTLLETNLTVDVLDHGKVAAILRQIARTVPVGNAAAGSHADPGELWYPSADQAPPSRVGAAAMEAAAQQLGTLGGGNHFIELQRSAAGRVWVMIHSGSRSYGTLICKHYQAVAMTLNHRWFSTLPDKHLAYLPWDTDEARDYWADMQLGLRWAKENRKRMAQRVIEAFGITVAGSSVWPVVDLDHNYAAWENHFGANGIVHRKGAVRARAGERVLIPGSMGTSSYVAIGKGNPESFSSCQHGAGRARSRAATKKMVDLATLDAQLEAAGTILVTPSRKDVIDEAAIAYKDIDAVMAASTDLVDIEMQLWPIGVVKG
jgi:tRNA-splicing ligase RtcB